MCAETLITGFATPACAVTIEFLASSGAAAAVKAAYAGFFVPSRFSRPLLRGLVGSSRRIDQTNICARASLVAIASACRT